MVRPTLLCLLASLLLTAAAPAQEDAAALFQRGREQMRSRQFEAAVASFEKCVAQAAGDSRYHHWLGRALGLQAQQAGMFKAMGMIGRIRESLEKAVELNPANLEARQDLTLLYLITPSVAGGSKEKARSQVDAIRRRDPALAAQLEGDLANAEKRLDDARAAYQRAAQLAPNRAEPLVRQALIFQRAKQWEEAFGALERALKAESRNPSALYQFGRTGALSGQRLEKAEASLRTYLTLRPEFSDPPFSAAHFRLGNVLEKKGDAAGAKAEYATALRLDPKNKEARAALEKLKG